MAAESSAHNGTDNASSPQPPAATNVAATATVESQSPQKVGGADAPEEHPQPVVEVHGSNPQEPPVRVRMRQKTPITAKPNGAAAVGANGLSAENGPTAPLTVGNPAAGLSRAMETLYEPPPELEDNNEEIRKLDSQLDHLNEYVGKVEERIKQHNAKMLETLRHQREEREKRRRSFHERLEADRQEDVEFQNQLASILHRLDISRKRQSAYDLSNVEIPAVGNGVHADHKPSVL